MVETFVLKFSSRTLLKEDGKKLHIQGLTNIMLCCSHFRQLFMKNDHFSLPGWYLWVLEQKQRITKLKLLDSSYFTSLCSFLLWMLAFRVFDGVHCSWHLAMQTVMVFIPHHNLDRRFMSDRYGILHVLKFIGLLAPWSSALFQALTIVKAVSMWDCFWIFILP